MSLKIQVLQQQKTESGKLYHLFIQNLLYLTLTTVSITRNLFCTSRNSHTLVINSLNLKKTSKLCPKRFESYQFCRDHSRQIANFVGNYLDKRYHSEKFQSVYLCRENSRQYSISIHNCRDISRQKKKACNSTSRIFSTE